MQNNSIDRYGILYTTQSFIWKGNRNNKVGSFSSLFLMFTLTWIKEKELERVIENEGDEFRRKKHVKIQSRGEKMRNASGQQGAASKV